MILKTGIILELDWKIMYKVCLCGNLFTALFLRVLATVILSVCPSFTTSYRFKTKWDRDFEFLPHDSFMYLVFCDKISCLWVRRVKNKITLICAKVGADLINIFKLASFKTKWPHFYALPCTFQIWLNLRHNFLRFHDYWVAIVRVWRRYL